MPLLSLEELKLYESIINLSQKNMRLVMEDYLKKQYNQVIANDDYIYAIGDIPIALVAHLDTVAEESYESRIVTFNNKKYLKPENRNVVLYYDQWQEKIASNEIIGSDDRAGVYAIYRLIEAGLRPSVILTTDEEIGGVGARKFVSQIEKPLSDINYIIQLDRRGVDDCVFYNLNSPEFEKYIESFGFKKETGSFSDISTICPAWGIAGVNLSIGYDNEHSVQETLDVRAWLATIEKVTVMLKETDIPFWPYVKKTSSSYMDYPPWYDDDSEYYIHCYNCDTEIDVFSAMPVLDEMGTTKYICLECYEKLDTCSSCGDWFIKKKKHWKVCKNCAKEMKKFGRRNK